MSRLTQEFDRLRRETRTFIDQHRTLLLIATFGMLLRLVWVLWASREPTGIFDPTMYRYAGVHIGSGNGYLSLGDNPTAYYPPGYPYFIGAIYSLARILSVTDSYTLLIGLAQVVISTATIAAVGLIGYEIAGRVASIVAATCFAVWPSVIVYTSVILSETLYMGLLAGFVLCLVRLKAPRTSSVATWKMPVLWWAAFFLAAGVLTRPQSALIGVPIVAIIWLCSKVSLAVVVQRVGVLVFVTLIMLTPWIIRNAVQLGGFVPLSNNTGHNLCIGFNPDATGGFMLPDICDQTAPYVTSTEAELEHNAVNQQVALRSIRDHWTKLPALSVKKVWYTFNGDTAAVRALESYLDDPFLTNQQRSVLQGAATVSYFSILAVSLLATVSLIRHYWKHRVENQGFLVVVGLLLGGVLVPVLSFGDQRFKDSLYPLFAVLVGVGLAHFYQSLLRNRLLR